MTLTRTTRHLVITADLAAIVAAPLPWSQLRGKTVLVSGANGFLPAYMVETMLYLNEVSSGPDIRVLGLVRNENSARARFACYEGRQDLSFLVQDVCDPAVVEGPVDVVLHAASQASPKYYGRDPVGTLSANVLGTHHLLTLARAKQAEAFIFFSSGEVYGDVAPEQVPTREDWFGYLDPAQVRSCYAESKRLGETMCVAWTHQYGLNTKIVRPFHTYGPGLRLDDGRVYADFIADVVQGQDIIIKSDGRARRAFCYLADAVRGFFTVAFRGLSGQAYNVGNDTQEMSVLELAERIVRLFPDKRLKVIRQELGAADYIPSPVVRNAPDITKARALGWEPVVPVDEGFTRTIESFT